MKRLAKLAHRLIYDNKWLMVVSLAVSVVVWLFVTILLSPTDVVTLRDVPVEIDLTNGVPAQFGFEIFGQRDYTVDVEITGKRYVIGSLTSDSNVVKVVAQTQYVDAAGKNRLTLKATKARESDEFEIVSCSEDTIDVYVDTYVENNFPLKIKLDAPNGVAKDGYITSDPILSESIINVSGPATEVNSIKSVEARIKLEKPLAQTETFDAEIVALNESGGMAHYLTFNKDNSAVSLTVPIYAVTEKPTSVELINAPLRYHETPLKYTVEPAVLKAGVRVSENDSVKVDDMESLKIATIDFADLKPGTNTFHISVSNLTDLKVISDIQTLLVTVEVPDCTIAARKLTESNVSFTNAPEDYQVAEIVSGLSEVTLVGPADSVNSISVQDITAMVDLTDADPNAETQTFTATVAIKDSSDCWVYGHYSVTVRKK